MSEPANSDPILEDPFWEVLHERHPDVDIVLLPAEPPLDMPADVEVVDPEPVAAANTATARAIWTELAEASVPQRVLRWIAGPARDTVRHTVMFTLEGVDEASGRTYMRAAESLVRREGWNVFIPPRGIPRINAGRPGTIGDEELLVGYNPAQHSAFMRLTSTGIVASDEETRQLIGGQHE